MSVHDRAKQLFTISGMRRKLRDELLNCEIFYTLMEAKVLIERWREHYNRFRPHSSLGYRPPAPEATEISMPGAAILMSEVALELT